MSLSHRFPAPGTYTVALTVKDAAGKSATTSQAVLVNSTAGHAFESDDMHKASLFHPGSICLPVALACAEAEGGPGTALRISTWTSEWRRPVRPAGAVCTQPVPASVVT